MVRRLFKRGELQDEHGQEGFEGEEREPTQHGFA